MTDASHFAYVGSRTNAARKARGEGITVYAIQGGDWDRVQTLDIEDPSFLAVDQARRFLYASQGDGSNVRAFVRDPLSGKLTALNSQPSHGLNGAHLAVDPSDRFVVVANYLTAQDFVSNVAVFPIAGDGSLMPASHVYPTSGKLGPNRREQDTSKPHQVQFSPNGRFMTLTDKGLDEVFVFTLDAAGRLHQVDDPPVRMRWGAAPRHVSFHPSLPILYILNEIDSTVVTAQFEETSGKVTPFQIVSSMSDRWVLHSSASHIMVSPNGRFVYASNRGQNTIAVFGVEGSTGRLTPIEFADSGGKVPRYFAFTPDHRNLYVANEASDSVAHFIVGTDGRLRQDGVAAETGTPTCIVIV